jgi:hypothetical protein
MTAVDWYLLAGIVLIATNHCVYGWATIIIAIIEVIYQQIKQPRL